MVPRAPAMPGRHPAQSLCAPVLCAEASARLERLYRLYADRVLAVAVRRTGNRDVAQDVAGDVWLRAGISLARGLLHGGDESAWPWLAAITRRAAIDHFRPARSHERPTDWDDPVHGRALPTAPPAEDAALVTVGVLELRRAIARLTPAQQAALTLRAEGLTWRAAGSRMGRNPTTVWQGAQRGARALAAAGVSA
ncbi:sigma-70 family RNA polymerase sigma factor [Nonomuraea sp. NPDC026600]|uniref:RNA polymerase sigma factor n=1 Tax=Nonomuraea sp. NPDC026600 TaxID=3155363 RepID=UPI0033F7C18A